MSAQSSRGSFHRVDSSLHLLRDTKLQYHPLSFIAFCVWTLYTIFLVVLLEHAVRHPSLAFSRWAKIWSQAPGLLITLFAQGHVAITAWYLGRLGISAFRDPRFAPKTWLEMFWISSNQWRSPLGWVKTAVSARKRHLELSVTFAAFVLSILFAMPAPLLLKRAYPFESVYLEDAHHTYPGFLMSLAPNTSNTFDPFTQVNIGQTAWASGFNVSQTYPSRIYYPTDSPAAGAQIIRDIVFSADVYPGANANLPSIRAQGGCQIVASSGMDLTLDASGMTPESFWDRCNSRNLGLNWTFHWAPGMDVTFDMAVCHNSHNTSLAMEDQGLTYWTTSDPPPDETALIWLNLTDYTNTAATQGVIQCDSSIATGIASISANSYSGERVFGDFPAKKLFNFSLQENHTSIPYWPPLLTALNYLSLPLISDSAGGINEQLAIWEPVISRAKMFGYALTEETLASTGVRLYRKPSLDEAAAALTSGMMHMTAAINMGSSTYKEETLHYTSLTPWFSRDLTYLALTLGVLAVWLGVISVLTAFLYRPALASGMDSYTIVRLCAERPDLLEEDYVGALHENTKMLETFRPADFTWESQLKHRERFAMKYGDLEESGELEKSALPSLGYREVH